MKYARASKPPKLPKLRANKMSQYESTKDAIELLEAMQKAVHDERRKQSERTTKNAPK